MRQTHTIDSTEPTTNTTRIVRQFLGAPVRSQTYKSALYLGIAFPLGVAYFVGFVTLGVLGTGLLIVWIGFPILLATLAAGRAVARFEASLARRLVGVGLSVPVPTAVDSTEHLGVLPGDGYVGAVRRLATSRTTWTTLLVVAVKLPFGIAAFTAIVAGGSIAFAMLAAPLLYADPSILVGSTGATVTSGYMIGPMTIDTLLEAVTIAVGGVFVAITVLNLLNLLAWAQATVIVRLLRFGTSKDDLSL